MPVDIITKGELSEQLDKYREVVEKCGSSAPVIASDITKNIEIAFDFNKIDRTELAKIHRSVYIEGKAFENTCSCRKK